jgi:hypothetical protein
MADYTIKQNDFGVPIRATLSDENGVVDLTAATVVRLLMHGTKTQTELAFTAAVEGTPTDGRVIYTWQAGDLSVADTYRAEFEVAFGGSALVTFPSDDYAEIEVDAELD